MDSDPTRTAPHQPLFPPGFPWWAVMVLFMLVTGYFQNWVRNQFYWYKSELPAVAAEFAGWTDADRTAWWAEHRAEHPFRYREVHAGAQAILDTWTLERIVVVDSLVANPCDESCCGVDRDVFHRSGHRRDFCAVGIDHAH